MSLVCQITPLFALESKRLLKPDSRVRIPTRTCGQRGHWATACPKRKGDDGKGQGKIGKEGKGKADGGAVGNGSHGK